MSAPHSIASITSRSGRGAGHVRNPISIAEPRGFRIQRRADHELRSGQNRDPRRLRIEHCSRANENFIVLILFCEIGNDTRRARNRECDFNSRHSPVRASFGDTRCLIRTVRPNHRDKSGIHDPVQHFQFQIRHSFSVGPDVARTAANYRLSMSTA